jgi:hypothetical protein
MRMRVRVRVRVRAIAGAASLRQQIDGLPACGAVPGAVQEAESGLPSASTMRQAVSPWRTMRWLPAATVARTPAALA